MRLPVECGMLSPVVAGLALLCVGVAEARAEEPVGVSAMAQTASDAPAPGARGGGRRWRGGRGPGHGAMGPGASAGQGHGHGRGGPGADPEFLKDRDMFHFLLTHRAEIRRRVEILPNGVKTLTESDNPEVAKVIRRHVDSMVRRVEGRRPIHMRDPLFAAVFSEAGKISVEVRRTKKGVHVLETSDDAYAARLIQAHAAVVDLFVAHGPAEVRKNHAVPKRPKAASTARGFSDPKGENR